MTITEILGNFQGLLAATMPFLLRSGLNAGDDAWDDFMERAFEVAVLVPLQEQHTLNVAWTYGTWKSPDDSPQIMVEVPQGTSAFVGKAIHRDPIIEVAYSEETLNAPVSFAFREFGNPLAADPMGGIEYVTGEVVDDGQRLPEGTQICVPFEGCAFFVA